MVRYEDGIENLTFQNVTFADPLKDGGGADPVGLLFENALFVAATVPAEAAAEPSNMAADASFFVERAANDFHLAPDAPAIDAGKAISEVDTDRDGRTRPSGSAYDVGAYEWTDSPPTSGAGGGGTTGTTTQEAATRRATRAAWAAARPREARPPGRTMQAVVVATRREAAGPGGCCC